MRNKDSRSSQPMKISKLLHDVIKRAPVMEE